MRFYDIDDGNIYLDNNDIYNIKRKDLPNVDIAIVGKYTEVMDSYISVIESIKHASLNNKYRAKISIVSSEDIDKGARWSTDIAKELEDCSFGILCVTKENLEAPWLLFEAGALSKMMQKGAVCPFLFDLKMAEIKERKSM